MDTFKLNAEEVTLLVAIVGQLDPDRYPSPNVKSLIYKCQGALNDKPKHLEVDFSVF